MPLTKYELETIINFNDAEDICYIFTYSKSWMSHLEKKLGLRPVRVNSFGGKEYELPKKWLRKPQRPPKRTEAQEKASKESMAKMRAAGRAPNQISAQKSPKGHGKSADEKAKTPQRSQ